MRNGYGSGGREGGGNRRGGNGNGNGNGGGGRGRGRGNGGGGGRGRGRGRGRGNGGGGGGRGRGRGRGGRRMPAAESGNKRERIQVESGALVLIDQFMLANPQFLEKVKGLLDSDPEEKDSVIKDFGGTVVELSPNTYRIARDPYALTIIIHEDGDLPETESLSERANESAGRVFVDTRCLAMIDRELLDDITLLEKYQQLWFSGQDKACRDLLRDNGGAVRYGFQRYGDELGVYSADDNSIVALWPDVVEESMDSSSDDDSEEGAESAVA